MAIGTIRRATDEDYARLNAAALRFAKLHNLKLMADETGVPAYAAVETEVDWSGNRHLRQLWLRCFRRATREPQADTVAYGYVGWSAKS